jgi:hypothetical protein
MAETLESLKEEVQRLRARLTELESKPAARARIEKMSAEVVDSNPYRCVWSVIVLHAWEEKYCKLRTMC